MPKRIPITQRPPAYQKTWNFRKGRSAILHPASHPTSEVAFQLAGGVEGLRELLWEWDHDSYTAPSGKTTLGRLQAAKADLDAAREQFEILNAQRTLGGRPELKEPPEDIQAKIDTAQAIYDLRTREVEELKKLISKAEEAASVVSKKEVQRRIARPSGIIKLLNSKPFTIDGQQVIERNGEFVIKKGEPHAGLTTQEYLSQVVFPYKAERDSHLQEEAKSQATRASTALPQL